MVDDFDGSDAIYDSSVSFSYSFCDFEYFKNGCKRDISEKKNCCDEQT